MNAAPDTLESRLKETYELAAKGELTYKNAQPTLETLVYSDTPRPQKTGALRAIINKLQPQERYHAAMFVHEYAKIFFDRPQGIPNRYLQPLAQQWALASIKHLPLYKDHAAALHLHRHTKDPKVEAQAMRIALAAVDAMPAERRYSNAIRTSHEAKLGSTAKAKALKKAAASIDDLPQVEKRYYAALEIYSLTIYSNKKLAAKAERKMFAAIRSMKPQQQYETAIQIAELPRKHQGYQDLKIKALERALTAVDRMPAHTQHKKRETIYDSAPEDSAIRTKIEQKILGPIDDLSPEEQHEAAMDVYHKVASPQIAELALKKAFATIDFLPAGWRHQAAMDVFLAYDKAGERKNDVLQKAFSDIKYLPAEQHSGAALKIFNAAWGRNNFRKEVLQKAVADLDHVKPKAQYKDAMGIVSNATHDEYKHLRMRALRIALRGVDAMPLENGERLDAMCEIIKHAPKEGRLKDQIDRATVAMIKVMPTSQQGEAARSVIADIGDDNEGLQNMLSVFVPPVSPPEPKPGLELAKFTRHMRKLAPAGP